MYQSGTERSTVAPHQINFGGQRKHWRPHRQTLPDACESTTKCGTCTNGIPDTATSDNRPRKPSIPIQTMYLKNRWISGNGENAWEENKIKRETMEYLLLYWSKRTMDNTNPCSTQTITWQVQVELASNRNELPSVFQSPQPLPGRPVKKTSHQPRFKGFYEPRMQLP